MGSDQSTRGSWRSTFFRKLVTLPPETAGMVQLLNAGIELLGVVPAIGSGRTPSGPSVQTLDREPRTGRTSAARPG